MNLLDFIQMGGQARRQALDEFVDDLNLERFVPPQFRPATEFVGEMNPVAALGNAMQDASVVFDPEQTNAARLAAARDMGMEVAMTLAPAALVRMGYLAAPAGLAETFALPVGVDQLARDAVSDVKYAARSIAEGDPRGVLEAFGGSGEPRGVGAEAVNVDGLPFGATEAERRAIAEREKYLNLLENRRNVKMYSPSLRAAENLPQNKGTYEQLKKWMLANGAKADELNWSGADAMFEGQKVTKEELIDYLLENTQQYKVEYNTSSGVLGAEVDVDNPAISPEEMVDQYVEGMLDSEVDYYLTEYGPDLIEDESDNYFRISDLTDTDLVDAANDLGVTPEELIENEFKTGGVEMVYRNDSTGEYEAIEDMEEAVKHYFGGEDGLRIQVEENLRETAIYEAQSDPETFYVNALGGDLEDLYPDAGQEFDPGETEYSEYFTKGGEDYQEKLFRFPNRQVNYEGDRNSTVMNPDVLPSAGHFDNPTGLISHSRTASFPELELEGSPTKPVLPSDYVRTGKNVRLVGELQSDIGQEGAGKKGRNKEFRTMEEMVALGESERLRDEAYNVFNREVSNISGDLGSLPEDVRDEANEIIALRQFFEKKMDEGMSPTTINRLPLNILRWPESLRNEFLEYQSQGFRSSVLPPVQIRPDYISPGDTVRLIDQFGPLLANTRNADAFVPYAERLQDARARQDELIAQSEEYYNIGNRTPTGHRGPDDPKLLGSLPYVDKTPKWVDMMLRQNIFDAIKSGEKVLAVPNPEMVRDMTMGTVEGQGEFYGNIVPRRLQEVVRKIDKKASLRPTYIQTSERGPESVYALDLDEDFVASAAKKGIPTWMIAGGLGLGGLIEYMKEQKENRQSNMNNLLGFGGGYGA